MSEPLLAVEGLGVTFRAPRAARLGPRPCGRSAAPGGVPAVRDVSFTVSADEVVALVGESGAGKTTTALAVLGLLPSSARVRGSVRLEGTSLLDLPDRAFSALRGARIAMVFQDPRSALPPVHRVGALLVEALQLHDRRLSRAAALARAAQLCTLVGLPGRTLDAYPHQLSGGQRQRVLVAVAVANRPRLIVADEPTSSLDVTVQAQVLEVLHRAREAAGASLLLITHDPGVVAGHADRVVVLRDGQVVEQGDVTTLFDAPRQDYTASLLRAEASAATRSEVEPTGPAAVELVDVHRTFRSRSRWRGRAADQAVAAMDGVSLVVPRGATLALVGESGSGKTTTALAIASLEPPEAGTVRVVGTDVSTVPRLGRAERLALRRRVQLVFQDAGGSLDPRMTVRESLAEGLRAAAATGTDVAGVLRLVGLPAALADRYPHELSGGQLQRVALARALAARPEVLVLDEPVSALDAPVRAALLALVDRLRDELRLTCVLVAHDLGVVRAHAELVAVMYRGRVVEQGPAHVVLDDPRHPYTRALLAAVPVADPRVRPAPVPLLDDDAPPTTGCRFRHRCALRAELPDDLAQLCTRVDPVSRRTEGRDVACHHADVPVQRHP
ncbi:ABC transporter ATP-binding protein [Cellulomonas sp. NTE-D12]|uniref:ABC transporter ATP-binding protein n=1 Tax=Cellulomonas sp. NTE-D12 TaxID=2962632 RepID=UPI003081EF61|nr:ABC transporter ATP-binding protein [Cellulomonas sp. NTE-D12]